MRDANYFLSTAKKTASEKLEGTALMRIITEDALAGRNYSIIPERINDELTVYETELFETLGFRFGMIDDDSVISFGHNETIKYK